TGRTTKVSLGQPVVSDIFPVVISNDAPAAFPVGTTTVTWTARDANGNVSSAVQKVTVKYGSFKILPPLSTRNATTFKRGSVIPVMFGLRDTQNRKVSFARATLSYAKMNGGVAGAEINAASIIPRWDNSFKYVIDQYLFTMSTAKMPAGQYRLSIKLDDGSTYYLYINLK
ncbi:MAG: PxKF domain-containing protein, partial [Ignavibacteriales bacterium]